MTTPAPGDQRRPSGRRERKKALTRAAIQQHALRLFRDRGYAATTVSQIAEAADVSESTFFRYFPTKEDLVLWDELDDALAASYRAQPTELGPLPALRAAFSHALGRLGAGERDELRERIALLLSVPPLRATLLDQLDGPVHVLTELIAERAGREPGDPVARTAAGAVIGVGLSVLFTVQRDPGADVVELLDEALGLLEAGLPL